MLTTLLLFSATDIIGIAKEKDMTNDYAYIIHNDGDISKKDQSLA